MEDKKQDRKAMTVRIPKNLHRKLKVKLLKKDKSFQGWCVEQIEEFVEGGND